MGKREHIYKIIAENIRKERRRLGITQAELAERADVSLDTIKSVENGRRAMSLDTYLNIVHALESSPTVLMSQQHPEKHIERKRSNPCTLTFKRPLTTVFLFSDVFWQLW